MQELLFSLLFLKAGSPCVGAIRTSFLGSGSRKEVEKKKGPAVYLSLTKDLQRANTTKT